MFKQANGQILAELIKAAAVPSETLVWRHHTGPGVRRYARSHRGQPPADFVPASINRRTGQPHEHRREIARRTGAR